MEQSSPQNTDNPNPQQPAVPAQQMTQVPSRNPFSMFKKIIYSVVGVVCFLGLIQVGLQNFFPENKSIPQTVSGTPAVSYPANVVWKTYNNKQIHYSVDYPDYLKFSETAYSTVFVNKENSTGSEEFPLLYISLIPDGSENTSDIYNSMPKDKISKFFSMRDGDTLETQSWPYAEYSTFKKLAAVPFAGTEAVVIENKNVLKGGGRVNRRILVRNGTNTILIGSYYKSQLELDTFKQFFESFKIAQ